MSEITLKVPDALPAALGVRLQDAEKEIRLMAALKMFDTGRISSGMAAELAGITRAEFLLRCGEYGVSVFQQTPEELEKDVQAAHETRDLWPSGPSGPLQT